MIAASLTIFWDAPSAATASFKSPSEAEPDVL